MTDLERAKARLAYWLGEAGDEAQDNTLVDDPEFTVVEARAILAALEKAEDAKAESSEHAIARKALEAVQRSGGRGGMQPSYLDPREAFQEMHAEIDAQLARLGNSKEGEK
jgi:hypothetical protein